MSAKTLGAVRRKFAPWDDPTATPLIEIRNLTKHFGEFIAVDNVSLKIYEREFLRSSVLRAAGKQRSCAWWQDSRTQARARF